MKLFPNFRSYFLRELAIRPITRGLVPILAARALDDKGARVPDIAEGLKGALKIGTSLS